ncbi:MAG: hypothetical protein L0H70_06015 [Xanthomonadales bacterium]|nr:hypothetical protein [Xanthomonadales bacterium]
MSLRQHSARAAPLLASVLLAALLYVLGAHAANPALGDWHYVKHAGRCQLLDAQQREAQPSRFVTRQSAHNTDVFGVQSATPPPGMQAQVMHLRLRSHGFFSREPGAHLALGVTGAWHKDNPATAANEALLAGRGVIIGNVSAALHGCTQAPTVQIESFRLHGNRLYPASCSGAMADNTWYNLSIVATRDGRVAYWISSLDGSWRAHHGVTDTTKHIPADLGGWWILHVFSNQHPQADWRIDIHDLQVQWLRQAPPNMRS